MKKPNTPLPDLDDDAAYTAKLRGLGVAVLPKTDSPDKRNAGLSDAGNSRISAAEQIARIEEKRGPKRRFEYLIPTRVGDALAADAAARGQSAATRLLEVLRSAGYPVIPEDFIDLRKERRG
jgi:hypothetical protein